MKVRVTSQFRVTGNEDLDAQTDRLLRALIALEGDQTVFTEADVTVSISDRLVGISVVVVSDSWQSADELAADFIRRGIEAIGGNLAHGAEPQLAGRERMNAEIQSTELIPA